MCPVMQTVIPETGRNFCIALLLGIESINQKEWSQQELAGKSFDETIFV